MRFMIEEKVFRVFSDMAVAANVVDLERYPDVVKRIF
jgi:hypothetical protein